MGACGAAAAAQDLTRFLLNLPGVGAATRELEDSWSGFSWRLGLDWTEAEISAHYPVLLGAYEAGIDTHTRLYPGAAEAVERLRARGVEAAICTNKPAALAELLLSRLGVRALFSAMIGADTLPVRKPDPAPLWAAIDRAGGLRGRAVLIGDTETDRSTGRAAGVPVVLVTFGPEGAGVAR
ncbi:MAG: HAD-IA family hydrolase, partial [Paracoccus hibiscisoli]|uniref:HAD-IA family hydrolase n=1 Tax=Paracoccus hibiscisoli TaxID=2023261 RepID=UPI00391893C8